MLSLRRWMWKILRSIPTAIHQRHVKRSDRIDESHHGVAVTNLHSSNLLVEDSPCKSGVFPRELRVEREDVKGLSFTAGGGEFFPDRIRHASTSRDGNQMRDVTAFTRLIEDVGDLIPS